jgi:hypothetical protein
MALATLSDAMTQLNANLNYEDSAASAKLALEAVRYILANRPAMTGGAGVTTNFASLEKLEERIAAAVRTSSTRRCSFTRGTLRYD